MALTSDTRPLAGQHVPLVSAMLARAFFDDPLFAWVEPEPTRRAAILPWMMGIGTQYGTRFGEVHGTADTLTGAAVWLPPGASIVDPARLEESGFVDPATVLGDSALQRFGAFMEHAEELHLRDMAEQHWYLMILGVDPPFQGRGLGGTIMQPVLKRADEDQLPCYLETAKERNVPFYRKHGFEVVHEGAMPPDGPRFWTMRRPSLSAPSMRAER